MIKLIKCLLYIFILLASSSAQDFSSFVEKSRPKLSEINAQFFDSLLSLKNIYYIESIATNYNNGNVSVSKIKIWVKEKIVLESSSSGDVSQYDPSKEMVSSGDIDSKLYTPDGIFAPLQTTQGVVKGFYNRIFLNNPIYPDNLFDSLNLVSAEPIKYLFNRYSNEEFLLESKKDYIGATLAKEKLDLLHGEIKLKNLKASIAIGESVLSYKLSKDLMIDSLSFVNEKNNFWMTIRNTYVLDNEKVPRLDIKINDFLLDGISKQYDDRYYGFYILKENGVFKMKTRDMDWSKYLYSSNIISDFFKYNVTKINGQFIDANTDIERILSDNDTIDVAITTSSGERSFNFIRIGERERYILKMSKALGYSPDIYFKIANQSDINELP